MKGKVKWFNNKNRYGFIEKEDGTDIFVHVSGLNKGYHPKDGDDVEFDVTDGEKGPVAINVKLV